jgi:hypothetical protein
MVEEGRLASKELLSRMNRMANFGAARSEIAAELAKETDQQFHPDDYEIPAGYDFDMPAECESLTPEDVVLATSGGCSV